MKLFKCREKNCKGEFYTSYSLQAHLRQFHKLDTSPTVQQYEESFNCETCGKMFSSKTAIILHNKNFHRINESSHLVCSVKDCTRRFTTHGIYTKHLYREHSLQVELQEHEFLSFADFETWKSSIENDVKAFYSRNSSQRKFSRGAQKKLYSCTGYYSFIEKNNDLKTIKSSSCPSRMEVTMKGTDESSSVKVKYYMTHFGHSVDLEENIKDVTDDNSIARNVPKQRCRTCLTSLENKIYTNVTVNCIGNKSIKNAILEITPQLQIKIKDNDHVCSDCLLDLKNALAFLYKVLKSDNKLFKESKDVKKIKGLSRSEVEIVEESDNYTDDIYLNRYNSQLEHTQTDPVSKEIEYWNRCSQSFKSQMIDRDIIRNNIVAAENSILTRHSNVVSVRPLNISDLTEFTKKISKETLVTEFFNFNNTQGRVLLLGTRYFHECPVCNNPFISEKSLLLHFDKFHKNVTKAYLIKPYQNVPSIESLNCETCGETFNEIAIKKEHTATCRLVNCPYCNKTVLKQDFDDHMEKQHDEHYPFVCCKTNTVFFSFEAFKAYTCENQNSTVNQEKKKCSFCQELIPLKIFRDHLQTKHPTYICATCGQSFDKINLLATHEVTHQKELCTTCGKLIARKIFKKHVKDNHPEQSTNVCSICDRTFYNVRLLNNHIQRIHSQTICEICGISLRYVYLKKHYKLKHSEIENYSCDKCPKQFARKEYLRVHLKRHERRAKLSKGKKNGYIQNPNDPLICRVCLKTFRSVSDLKVHTESKHGRYQCSHCNKTFKQLQDLRKHQKCHAKTRLNHRPKELIPSESTMKNSKFQCGYCDKYFSEDIKFNLHLAEAHLDEEEVSKEKDNLLDLLTDSYIIKLNGEEPIDD